MGSKPKDYDKLEESRRQDYYSRGRRLFCTKCKSLMHDCEPATESGKFHHPYHRRVGLHWFENPCPNAGKTFSWDPSRKPWRGVKYGKGIRKVHRRGKAYYRARKRGAKLAAKLTRRSRKNAG
jgi:hypothetical protein